MLDIEAALATKRHAAYYVEAEPAANNTRAPLCARRFEACAGLSLLSAVWALYCLRGPLSIHARHTLVPLELLCPKKLAELLLPRLLRVAGVVRYQSLSTRRVFFFTGYAFVLSSVALVTIIE